MRILILSHALVQKASQERWRRLAQSYPHIQVRLVIPEIWESTWFNDRMIFHGATEDVGNFQVRTLETTSRSNFSVYFFRGLAGEIRQYRPDLIFAVHESYQTAQAVLWRLLFARHARLIFFTMNVLPRHFQPHSLRLKHLLNVLASTALWWLIRHGTDGAICHYPEIEEQLRKDGYKKPVLVQTQIGVDKTVFHPNPVAHEDRRATLGKVGFVIGYAGRITPEKGVLDIATVMRRLPADTHLLIVGDGPARADLQQMAAEYGWQERLHVTGYVPVNEVATWMRTMDCFVIASRVTAKWVDTFPLVVAQAMATGLPVVGARSGAIPFQLGGYGLTFDEGDTDTLARHLLTLYDNSPLRTAMGNALRERALAEFCLDGMNQRFYEFVSRLSGSEGLRN